MSLFFNMLCTSFPGSSVDPQVGKIPWRRKWQPTPVLLLGKFHGWRSLVCYRPWGRKESDTTEWLHFHFEDFIEYLFIFRKHVQGDSISVAWFGFFTLVKSLFLQSEQRWLQESCSPLLFGDSQSSLLISVFVEKLENLTFQLQLISVSVSQNIIWGTILFFLIKKCPE